MSTCNCICDDKKKGTVFRSEVRNGRHCVEKTNFLKIMTFFADELKKRKFRKGFTNTWNKNKTKNEWQKLNKNLPTSFVISARVTKSIWRFILTDCGACALLFAFEKKVVTFFCFHVPQPLAHPARINKLIQRQMNENSSKVQRIEK